jgi:uncharacterized membrane protein
MDLHPIFNHFPIALFTIYSVLEVLRFKKITSFAPLFYIKGAFIIAGAIISPFTIITGKIAGEALKNGPDGRLVEMHETAAIISVIIFGIIALVYLIEWISRSRVDAIIESSPWKKAYIQAEVQSRWLLNSVYLPLIALLGLILITITGALGGSIVYGPDIDPFAKFVYNFLIK